MREIENIIEALGRHCDDSAVQVLEEVGTNSSDTFVRELTAKALVSRNSQESLRVVLISKGKGVNDLDARVAETAISSLKSLQDKSEAIRILEDAMNLHSDEEIKNRAREVKEMICTN